MELREPQLPNDLSSAARSPSGTRSTSACGENASSATVVGATQVAQTRSNPAPPPRQLAERGRPAVQGQQQDDCIVLQLHNQQGVQLSEVNSCVLNPPLARDDDEDKAREEALATLNQWTDPELLKGWRLSRAPIGEGATSMVYKASRPGGHTVSEETLRAVKVLSPSEILDLRGLQREVAVLRMVQGHPNIVTLYGLCRVDPLFDGAQRWALVLEFSRRDLFDCVKHGRMSEPRAAEVTHGILAAIAFINARSLIHRDVKVENILMTRAGKPLLNDFGSAVHQRDTEEMQRRRGSPGYCAPEILLGQRYDIQCDCFSVGVCAYFLLTRKKPFSTPCAESSEVIKKTILHEVDFENDPLFSDKSRQAKNALLLLLTKDPLARPCAATMLGNPWFCQDHENAQDQNSSGICTRRPRRPYTPRTDQPVTLRQGTRPEDQNTFVQDRSKALEGEDHKDTFDRDSFDSGTSDGASHRSAFLTYSSRGSSRTSQVSRHKYDANHGQNLPSVQPQAALGQFSHQSSELLPPVQPQAAPGQFSRQCSEFSRTSSGSGPTSFSSRFARRQVQNKAIDAEQCKSMSRFVRPASPEHAITSDVQGVRQSMRRPLVPGLQTGRANSLDSPTAPEDEMMPAMCSIDDKELFEESMEPSGGSPAMSSQPGIQSHQGGGYGAEMPMPGRNLISGGCGGMQVGAHEGPANLDSIEQDQQERASFGRGSSHSSHTGRESFGRRGEVFPRQPSSSRSGCGSATPTGRASFGAWSEANWSEGQRSSFGTASSGRNSRATSLSCASRDRSMNADVLSQLCSPEVFEQLVHRLPGHTGRPRYPGDPDTEHCFHGEVPQYTTSTTSLSPGRSAESGENLGMFAYAPSGYQASSPMSLGTAHPFMDSIANRRPWEGAHVTSDQSIRTYATSDPNFQAIAAQEQGINSSRVPFPAQERPQRSAYGCGEVNDLSSQQFDFSHAPPRRDQRH